MHPCSAAIVSAMMELSSKFEAQLKLGGWGGCLNRFLQDTLFREILDDVNRQNASGNFCGGGHCSPGETKKFAKLSIDFRQTSCHGMRCEILHLRRVRHVTVACFEDE